jgi:hypothetical protein
MAQLSHRYARLSAFRESDIGWHPNGLERDDRTSTQVPLSFAYVTAPKT